MRKQSPSEIGRSLTSRDRTIGQDVVDLFAKATGDDQYIHHHEGMKTSRFGGTIVHGFLLLSLLPAAFYECFEPFDKGLTVYSESVTKVDFIRPVKVGEGVRFVFRVDVDQFIRPRLRRLELYTSILVRDATEPAATCEFRLMLEKSILV